MADSSPTVGDLFKAKAITDEQMNAAEAYLANPEPVCPKCGCSEHFNITTRRRYKCAGCGSQFSVALGTIFASRKLSFMDLCGAEAILVNAVKGLSALQLGHDLSVSYKTDTVNPTAFPLRRLKLAVRVRPMRG